MGTIYEKFLIVMYVYKILVHDAMIRILCLDLFTYIREKLTRIFSS